MNVELAEINNDLLTMAVSNCIKLVSGNKN